MSESVYTQPTTTPQTTTAKPQPHGANPQASTHKPCVWKLLIHGQIIKVNQFYYSYLHAKYGVVCLEHFMYL